MFRSLRICIEKRFSITFSTSNLKEDGCYFLMHSHKCDYYLVINYCLSNFIKIARPLFVAGKTFDGAIIEVTLAKPVDKETYSKTSPIRTQRQGAVTGATTAIPTTFGFLPVEYSLLPALYPTTAAPGYLPSPGK